MVRVVFLKFWRRAAPSAFLARQAGPVDRCSSRAELQPDRASALPCIQPGPGSRALQARVVLWIARVVLHLRPFLLLRRGFIYSKAQDNPRAPPPRGVFFFLIDKQP
jgi:hypothetical protein